MEKCWAKAVSDCCGNPSLEHYISRALFEGPKVRVQGFAWCKDERRRLLAILVLPHVEDLLGTSLLHDGAKKFS